MKETRICIVVQGRFHAFALAKALIEKGAPVHVVTNYPAFIAQRFGLPASHVSGCAPIGLLHRYASRWDLMRRIPALNRALHQGFSLWAAGHVSKIEPVAVHVFSGVALELFERLRAHTNPVLRLLLRGSEHIVDQYIDLEQESLRAGGDIDKPSQWMVRRELREYALTDHVVTLSTFARNTFLRRGFAPEKINLLPLATNVKQFRPAREAVEARLRRIQSDAPLQMLCTGSVSLQKGVLDFVEMARRLRGRVRFRWVGNVLPDARRFVNASTDIIDFVPRVPENDLPQIYDEADGFVFPTIQDGFAVVLAQAKAACLPIVATENSAAPDLLEQGATGWTFPIRRPDLFVEKMGGWDADRGTMARMVENLWADEAVRDWSDVADDFSAIVKSGMEERAQKGSWPS